MRALYGLGDIAGALAVYRDAHCVLADELGIDPGQDLHVLHRPVLVRRALDCTQRSGFTLNHAEAITELAAVHLICGDRAVAARHAHQAVAAHRRSGYRRAEAKALIVYDYARADRVSAAPAALLTELSMPAEDEARSLIGRVAM